MVFGESSYFAWLNAGKKSVVLNLAEDKGFELLQKLIDRSDILVQNLKPGALQKLGFELANIIEIDRSSFHYQYLAFTLKVLVRIARPMIC